MRLRTIRTPFLLLTAALLCAPGAFADPPSYSLVLKDHKFEPPTVTIPAGQKVKLHIKNEDAMPAEFESYDLNREKVVVGHGQIVVYIGPLDAGKYEFFDDFHRDSTRGHIVAETQVSSRDGK